MIRRLLCRWFHLVRAEDIVEQVGYWDDLWQYADFRPVWPRIVNSDSWRKDFEPWFKKAVLITYEAMARERDLDTLRMLQVRAILLNEWLEQPRLAMVRDEAKLQNEFMSGRYDPHNRQETLANGSHTQR